MHSMLVLRRRREDVLFHRVDVGLDQIGDVEVAVDDVVGDRVHDRVGAQLQRARARRRDVLRTPASPPCSPWRTVTTKSGPTKIMISPVSTISRASGHRLVLDVVDRLEHQEQRLVVALQLRPLVGVHGVLDGQFVQAEHVGDGLHLVFVGFVQADPDEGFLALGFELVHLVQRRGVGVLAGQPVAVDVDAAVDHRPRDGDMDGLGVRVGVLGPGRSKGGRQCAAKRRHRLNLPSQRRPDPACGQCYAWAVVDRRFRAGAGALVSTPENLVFPRSL